MDKFRQVTKPSDRQGEYFQMNQQVLSPQRHDPFSGDQTPANGTSGRTYQEILKTEQILKEEQELKLDLAKKFERKDISKEQFEEAMRQLSDTKENEQQQKPVRKNRFSRWNRHEVVSKKDDAVTPAHPSSFAATPSANDRYGNDQATPVQLKLVDAGFGGDETPAIPLRTDDDNIVVEPEKKKTRWDIATPSNDWEMTPKIPSNNFNSSERSTSSFSATPKLDTRTPQGEAAWNLKTPRAEVLNKQPQESWTSEMLIFNKLTVEMERRNQPMSDTDLDRILPGLPQYRILIAPANYKPVSPGRKLSVTPSPFVHGDHFVMPSTNDTLNTGMKMKDDLQPYGENMPLMKNEDLQYFSSLMKDVDESQLSADQIKERTVMTLLLKIKNGTPPMRKSALRQLTERAKEFGAMLLFNQILPILMSPTLEDLERHLMVKVIDRILYKLDDLVRPYVHKILIVIEPLLIDEDYYARVEGREIISNLAKAAGLATMISTMRPDIDNRNEYVRNTTARAFAVVASALGIPALLPFLKAVCKSKKSWQARHTGIKIIQQIAILMGCAVLPHLRGLVDTIEHGLEDDQQKVRTIAALAVAALAEASTPFGIESFDMVLKPLWKGIRSHHGKGLAAFLKAVGYLIPLMDAESSSFYTKEIMLIIVREFASPDDEMKKIVLKVVKQCCATDGVDADYIRKEILPSLFRHFWTSRLANEKKNLRQVIETTVEIAGKVGGAGIVQRIVDDLKNSNEQYRKMVLETIEKILTMLGSADIDKKLEEQLVDGIMFVYQEQTQEDVIILNGFGSIVIALGRRMKAYLPQIVGNLLWRFSHKSAKVRQQAADVVIRISTNMKLCQEDKLLQKLGHTLYENLGEEYPEVLGSMIGALKSIVNVLGMKEMQPPIKDLLPKLTPILKNRHEKVQEHCVDLVGRIADLGSEHASAREWMRICFELLELLKAHKKSIRRAAINTFGYIAKAIGPHDVLSTLLNNLKVQERQNRVCTTVAIAIVAETCAPFTVLPGLMNEYRVPELNVQNGVLKSLAFMFEYIGEMGKDYIYAVVPLLEDALQERDLVHRQLAMNCVGHMAIGVTGFGCEDALVHMLNCLWPNIFEESPHVIQAFIGAIDGLRVALGPIRLLLYCLQGLFHPARRVRDVYWKVYNNIYIGGQDALVSAYPSIKIDTFTHQKRRLIIQNQIEEIPGTRTEQIRDAHPTSDQQSMSLISNNYQQLLSLIVTNSF
ncbi:hypothetical protein SNEBB_009203 [Seison nebaliae]|nr:hypothetical protein SNEBB_009203 [Seison nebaliae]